MDLSQIAKQILMKHASATGGMRKKAGVRAGKMCMCRAVMPEMMGSAMMGGLPMGGLQLAGKRTKGAKDKKPRKRKGKTGAVPSKLRDWVNRVKAYQAQTGLSYKD
jgi:hypothetical protein